MMSVTASIEKDVKNSNPMVKPYLFLKSTIYIFATILSGRNTRGKSKGKHYFGWQLKEICKVKIKFHFFTPIEKI